MITAPEAKENHVYRLFLIGKKSLPEIRKSEARASEHYWARVGGIFENPSELTKELVSDEFRKGDAARPVGEGKYAIVKHQNHAELAYTLEIPNYPGEAQKELGIEKALIHQKEWTGEPVSIICKRYGTSRKSYYK